MNVVESRRFNAGLRRFMRRVFALILVCASLSASIAYLFALPVDAVDTRPYIGDRYGISREDIVRWLQSHENDYYYIGTPYGKLAYTAPNGDPTCTINPGYSTGGQPLMNCAGFVAHVVYKCGLDVAKWNGYLRENYPALYNRQNYNLASADMWYLHVTGDSTGFQGNKELTGAFRYYSFPSLFAALDSGRMRKGDLFIFWPKEGYAKDRVYQDSHIGVYWGDYPGENKFWHMLWPYCKIDAIYTFKGPYDFIVIPFSEDTDSGTLTVTERNARGETLAGAKFTVTDASGNSFTFGPTANDGSASIFLPTGTYTVTQSAFPSGYSYGFEQSWSVTIARQKTTAIGAVCDLAGGTLKITQKHGKLGVAGGVYTAVRQSDGRTITIPGPGDSGQTSVPLPPGTYAVTLTSPPTNYLPKDVASWTVSIAGKRTVGLTAYVIPEKGTLAISVLGEKGEGVPGAKFFAVSNGDKKKTAIDVTNGSGRTSVELDPGEYTVTMPEDPPHYLSPDKTSWTVTVASRQTTELTATVTPKKGAVGIRVVDSEGYGVPGVYYEIYDSDDLFALPLAEVMTDFDGKAFFGIENGGYTLEHGDEYYFRFLSCMWDEYLPEAKSHPVTVSGGETAWVGGGSLTFRKKSTIALSEELAEGEYSIYTDADCTVAATVPNDSMTADVPATISGANELVIGEGTYYLRAERDLSNVHDALIVTYVVTSRAGEVVEVTPEGAIIEQYVRHHYEKNGPTQKDGSGAVRHFCDGCGEFILFGDVNDDGVLNARDVLILMRSLAGIDVEFDKSVQDVDPDGKLNAKDVTTLMKLLVK